MIYSINIDSDTKTQIIILDDGNSKYFIPSDEDNTDYQAYLQWLAEGNEPEIIENT
jgi:hypothetical protein